MASLPIRLLLTACVLTTLDFAYVTRSAHAYCRETVESKSSGPCVEAPGAARLRWKRSCMRYAFNEQFFKRMPLLSEDQIRESFDASFQVWSEVECSEARAPFFVEQLSKLTKTDESQFLFDIENESVVSARTRREWQELEHDDNALALTLLWHNAKTGEILDVDMEFNTGTGRFADCEAGACGRDMMDLRNTVTHEAGHLLGLGHSDISGSTMINDALDSEIGKRTLEEDDREGYCSLALPGSECEASRCSCEVKAPAPVPQTRSTCSVRNVGVQSSASWAVVLGFFALLAVRRRRTR